MKTTPLLAASLLALAAPGSLAADDAATNAARYRPWGVDLAGADHTVKPGDDFDRYVSGTWERTATIDPDQSYAGPFIDLYKLSQQQLRDLIQQAPAGSPLGDMYGSFADEAAVEQAGATPLQADIAAVRAIPDKAAFAAFVGAAQQGYGDAPFDLDINPDPKQPARTVLFLGQGGLGLPDRDFYLAANFKAQRDAYRAFMTRALTMAGYPDPDQAAATVFAFETEIARLSWAAADRRDIDKINNPMTAAQLAAYAPGFDWPAYLDASGITRPETVIVQEKTAIQAIAALVARTPLETLKGWEALHVTLGASPYLSKRFVDSRFDFYKTITGQTEIRPRWRRGVQLVDQSLGELAGEDYVRRNFTPAAKAQMTALVANLKAAMHDRIAGADWMAPETKREALEKLGKMRVMVGYPDKWRDYRGLKLVHGDLYGNVRRSKAFEFQYKFVDLYKPVDHMKWQMTPQTVNAYNGELDNQIVFPAGFLQPPMFNPAADAAVNYGAIGAVIGHEISHGFDDQGRKIDASGAVRDWWTPADAKRFQAQAAVFGKQFDGYEPVPGMHVNGQLTMGENIADLAGVLVALDAYHKSLGGKPAPVIGGLTGDQRFFLAYAQAWREKARPDALKTQMAADPHTPSRFRAIGPVRNVDAWYQAFGVQPGTAYYLKPADRARIW